jgi:hypothetical protein
MQFLTPAVFDTLIIVVIVIGLAFAGVRVYRDMTRPLPPDRAPDPALRFPDAPRPPAARPTRKDDRS